MDTQRAPLRSQAPDPLDGPQGGQPPPDQACEVLPPLPLPGLPTCLELTVPAAPLTPAEGNGGFALSSPAWL